LRTFTAHFSAVRGAVQVDSLGLLDSEDNYPRAALGLTAAAVCLSHLTIIIDLSHPQVERALTFWAEKVITLQMILDTKSKSSKGSSKVFVIPKSYNRRGEGKIAISESTSFNESNWGAVTRIYMGIVMKTLRTKSFKAVIEKTKALMKDTIGQAGGSRLTTDDGMDVDEPDPYSLVVDVSDSDEELKCAWCQL
jgi:hypothetical protein